MTQLGHMAALLGFLNYFILKAAREHLAFRLDLQERIVSALLTPLVVGDIVHLALTFWALGPNGLDWRTWGVTTWSVVMGGVSLLIPRVCWHLGKGRYMHKRDGKQYSQVRAAKAS